MQLFKFPTKYLTYRYYVVWFILSSQGFRLKFEGSTTSNENFTPSSTKNNIIGYIFLNLVAKWISQQVVLVWVSGGGANVHKTRFTKLGTGIELHSSYFFQG